MYIIKTKNNEGKIIKYFDYEGWLQEYSPDKNQLLLYYHGGSYRFIKYNSGKGNNAL